MNDIIPIPVLIYWTFILIVCVLGSLLVILIDNKKNGHS